MGEEVSMQGPLLRPGDAAYDETRQSFNGMLDPRPAAIALVESVEDVQEALAMGLAEHLQIGVRGGGHSVAGHGIVDRGLVIDLRRMRTVDVDPAANFAHAAGGATWEDFDTATQAHGLATTGGTFIDTGIGGLALGGGIGFLLGAHGLTCDNIVGAQLVSADGTVREVSESSDRELLWALRGGGGNFGVVTRFDFSVHPVTTIWGDSAVLALGDGAVYRRLAEVMAEAPDEFMAISYVADRPEFGVSIRLHVASIGDEATARTLHGRILDAGDVIDSNFRRLTYAEVQRFAGTLPFGLRNYWKSAFVPDLTDQVVREIVELVEQRPPDNTGFLIEPIHGKARRFGFDHAAFPQREARWHTSALGIWEEPTDDDRAIAWVREAHRRVTALGTTGTYMNYIGTDEPVDRATSTWPPDVLARLRAVKRRVDPENVFRSNLNIAPG
jgi:FAD/FMN-containing dehydrogenase